MKLTEEIKKNIDNLNYHQLLSKWRFSPSGDPWFQGEIGSYFKKRLFEVKSTVDHVSISKEIGW